MIRYFAKPLRLTLFLAFCTFIPVMMASVRVVEIPLSLVPDDSLRLMVAPYSFFLHSLAGAIFGIAGPFQFYRVLRQRFGRLHRMTGWAYVASGLLLGSSGLGLLLQVDSISTSLLDVYRGVMSLALCLSLGLGILAARSRDVQRHRAWMIRAYVIGMGSGTVALVMFPIYLWTGTPPTGLFSDIVFVGWWALNICLGEWVIRQGQTSARFTVSPANV